MQKKIIASTMEGYVLRLLTLLQDIFSDCLNLMTFIVFYFLHLLYCMIWNKKIM